MGKGSSTFHSRANRLYPIYRTTTQLCFLCFFPFVSLFMYTRLHVVFGGLTDAKTEIPAPKTQKKTILAIKTLNCWACTSVLQGKTPTIARACGFISTVINATTSGGCLGMFPGCPGRIHTTWCITPAPYLTGDLNYRVICSVYSYMAPPASRHVLGCC